MRVECMQAWRLLLGSEALLWPQVPVWQVIAAVYLLRAAVQGLLKSQAGYSLSGRPLCHAAAVAVRRLGLQENACL